MAWRQLDEVDIEFDDELVYGDFSRQLAQGVIRRTFNSPEEVTELIQRGADPGVQSSFRLRRSVEDPNPEDREHIFYPLLSLVIDNKSGSCMPSIWGSVWAPRPIEDEDDEEGGMMFDEEDGVMLERPVVLPQWSSPQLERDIMTALLDGGADVNVGYSDDDQPTMPIRVAILAGNEAAFDLLMQHQANLQDMMVVELPRSDWFGKSAPSDYEHSLLAMYRRLIQQDSTLATEEDQALGGNLVQRAAMEERGCFSQGFIDAYLDLVVENGASIRVTRNIEWTLLHDAVFMGSPCSADYLCRRLPAGDIDIRTPAHPQALWPDATPLAMAADRVDTASRSLVQHVTVEGLHDEELDRETRERDQATFIPSIKATIRTLLRTGADITRLPTANERQRRQRQLVLAEYGTVLSELPNATMSAINAALAPQRDYSMLLARLLPLAPHHDGAHPHPSPSNMAFGPHEAEGIAWKIGAFLYEPSAAPAATDEYLIGDTQLRRRVKAAVDHFVKSAATQTSSNREVVGGTRYEQQGNKSVKVTVPPLQCFAIRGSGVRPRQLGVREVVHKARMDEAAHHGVEGVQKGFNEHLGNDDCQFEWQQLGRLSRTRLLVPLGIE
ncbi:unnamed protein product [Vitrella brassicaformis CCMP3155]|uniref:Uncharacterized protein n=1 Tax=Vitrella brassicaformis (strain CCMP3155) TaxID=1169540 RepID=A0A0G4ERJ9_VITBC|nr:unnamed protein product [Vitrella brassicaformis CCMP3155]|eukprot:CEM00247.1 unnamed protein product [Vitrella brassicaformis CCMP3155]